MKRLKTLHIDSEMSWAGGQVQVGGLCSYLKQAGHEVVTVCMPGSGMESWSGEHDILSHLVAMKSSIDPMSVLKLRRIILRERPDIVHLHTSRAHVLGSAAAQMTDSRIVIATRRMDDPVKWIWPNTSAYGKWTTALVAISEAVKEVMIRSGADPHKIRLIESGADVDRFLEASPDPLLRKSLGVDDNIPLILITAVLAKRKGVDYLIQAAKILADNGNPVHVVIAGDGPQRAELEALSRMLGIRSTFLGRREDVPSLMASCDIFIMPSLTEGLGVAVLEAMASGKPVVASAVGGLRESVIDGETGILVPPRDPQAISEAISRLLADHSMSKRFGMAGRERVLSRYSIKRMAQRNEALYYELLKG